MLDFREEGKTRVTVEKRLGAKKRTTNKLNTQMASTPGFEPLGQIGGGRVLSPLRVLSTPVLVNSLSQAVSHP